MSTNKMLPQKVKERFQQAMKQARMQTGDTQETMAEKLHLSVREYGNLERGRHGLSAFTMLLFLETMADEAILCLLHECKDIIGENDELLGE